jgi:APA family basic amino acid/polyamine antiporter
MASDGVFFLEGERFTGTHGRLCAASPGGVGERLAISGTFDQLSDYVIFASWIFYGLVTSSVFVLRRKMPDAPRPIERWVIDHARHSCSSPRGWWSTRS